MGSFASRLPSIDNDTAFSNIDKALASLDAIINHKE